MTLFAFFEALWEILLDLSLWLGVGFIVAGMFHVLLPAGFIHRWLGGRGFMDVLKASLVGVPMPLCSCGVIPTAIGLKKDGASSGASTAFLISTPQIGVNSIFVSASFLGLPFALFKVFSALIMGLVGGALVNWAERGQTGDAIALGDSAPADERPRRTPMQAVVEIFRYGFGRLFRDIYLWIAMGVVVAALIVVLVPQDFFARYGWMQGPGGMLVMLAISLPLYVCATSSVPIAAGLIHAGLPAGSALVFLMAGPATNVATIGAIFKSFGRKITFIYLGTVIVLSLLFGWVFQALPGLDVAHSMQGHDHDSHGNLLSAAFAVLTVGLMIRFALQDIGAYLNNRAARKAREAENMETVELQVEGMTCGSCVAHVKRALESPPSTRSVEVDLPSGRVTVVGDGLDAEALIASVQSAGYKATRA